MPTFCVCSLSLLHHIRRLIHDSPFCFIFWCHIYCWNHSSCKGLSYVRLYFDSWMLWLILHLFLLVHAIVIWLFGIAGVNFSILLQHFIKLYGDNFLQSIKRLSEACNLSLDGDSSSQTSVPSKIVTVPSNKKLTPAKFEAWKMWHEDGLTFKEIAVSHY